MKKLLVVLVVMLSLCLVASFAFAGEMQGTVKSVNAKAGSIVVTVDGKDMSLKAAKDVDLGSVKAGEMVEVSVEKDMVTSVKAAPRRAPVGC